MIASIVKTSMNLRLLVIAVAALMLIYGIHQMNATPVDILPEFSSPRVEIQVEALGLSAQEVEAMITTPLEADMLNGTPWAKKIHSVALPGLASITLDFEKGTDIMHARQVAQERLIEVFALPKVSNQFAMINPVSSAGRVMKVGLTSDSLSHIEMSVLARWTIVPRLMGLPGVANVSIWGERQRQLQVQVDPKTLHDQGLTLMQIIKTTGNALWASPLSFLEASTPGTGGWIDTPNQRLGIRHILPIKTVEDLARVPIENASGKRLGEVAKLVENHQPLIGDALVGNEPSLMLVVEKFPWANTKDVTQQVEHALDELRPAVSGLQMDSTLFRPATYLDKAVGNLSTALLVGLALILALWLAFFSNWRMALIGATAVLMSVITAWAVIHALGMGVNMIILAGMLIALVVIIDDAIVDTDLIMRRLHDRPADEPCESMIRVLYTGIVGMRPALVYAMVIIALFVIPAMFLEGVSGAVWNPIAKAYLLALLASFAVALTLTPALSVLLLRNAAPRVNKSLLAGLMDRVYTSGFGWTPRRPTRTVAVVCVLALAGLACLPFMQQKSLLPVLKETDLMIHLEGGSSNSLPAMRRIASQISHDLQSIPGVQHVSALMGRALVSDRSTNINSGELWVSLAPTAEYDQTVDAVKTVVAGYPGNNHEVLTYLQHRVREELSGTGESFVVRVYGEDMQMIRDKAQEVQGVIQAIDGVADARVQSPPEMPIVEIEVDLEKAKAYGLKPGDVRRTASSLVSGLVVGALFEEQKVFDVVVWGTDEIRHNLTNVQNLLIDTPGGTMVPLKDVADVRIVPSVTEIHRDAVSRYMDVAVAVQGRDLAAVGDEVEDRLKAVTFPLEYRAELLGEYVELDVASDRVIAYAIAAGIGIFLLLQVFFRSWQLATVVFMTFPMALTGGMLAVFLTSGASLSLGQIMGFIAILGVAVRNSIMLISRYRQLEREGENFGLELVRRVTRERSIPILLTALTITLALLPAALFGNIAGLEIVNPLVIVLIGGMLTTTLYTLAGIPAIYLLFGSARESELGLPAPVVVITEEQMRGAMESN